MKNREKTSSPDLLTERYFQTLKQPFYIPPTRLGNFSTAQVYPACVIDRFRTEKPFEILTWPNLPPGYVNGDHKRIYEASGDLCDLIQYNSREDIFVQAFIAIDFEGGIT